MPERQRVRLRARLRWVRECMAGAYKPHSAAESAPPEWNPETGFEARPTSEPLTARGKKAKGEHGKKQR